jgi:hypothetical protein
LNISIKQLLILPYEEDEGTCATGLTEWEINDVALAKKKE